MAKFELKFIDNSDVAFIETNRTKDNLIEINTQNIISGEHFTIYLDKSTAIKFAKTIRTEINKITESEGENGGR